MITNTEAETTEFLRSRVDVLAGYVECIQDLVDDFRKAIVDSKPKHEERVWKKLNRYLKFLSDSHEKVKTYSLRPEHRAHVKEIADEIRKNTASDLQKMYFCIKNEVFTYGYEEDEQEPCCRARMLEICLDAFLSVTKELTGAEMSQRYMSLKEIIGLLLGKYEDKNGHQALCQEIYRKSIINLMQKYGSKD